MGMPMRMADSEQEDLMMVINTTPLIDVMLVLLVMLIITIPIQLHAVNMQLPTAVVAPALVKPQQIALDIDARSVITWQGERVDERELEARMAQVAGLAEQPEVHIRTDKDAPYAVFAKVLAASRRAGLTRIAVVGGEQFQ